MPAKRILNPKPDAPLRPKQKVMFDPTYIQHDYPSLGKAIGKFVGFGVVGLMPGLAAADFGQYGIFAVPISVLMNAEPTLVS